MARLGRLPGIAAYATLAVVAALFLAFALVTLRELDHRSAHQSQGFQNGNWFAHQAVAQLTLLQAAVTDHALLAGGTGHEAVQEQFDIFWSSVPILSSPEAAALFEDIYPVGELTASLTRDLERLEPLVAALAPGDMAAVREIQRTLGGMLERLLDFALEIHLGRLRQAAEREALDGRIFWRIATSIAGMLAALAGVGVLLMQETGRTRLLLREAGVARAEATDLSRRLQTVIDAVPALITASDPAARYGVAVGLEDRQGRLAQVVEVAELVRHVGQALLDGAANRVLAVAHDTGDRHADRGRDLAQQPGEVGRDGREQRAGEQDPAGQAVTDDPQDLMTDVGLQAVEREHDPPLDGQGGAPRLVHHCRDQLVVTVEQVGHRALAHRHAALPQGMMDLRHAAVLAVAECPDQGDHVEAELVLRQRDGAFGFGPVGPVVAGTAGRLATSDLQAQAHRPV
jgi:hypothetical protein